MRAGFVSHPNGVIERIVETREMPSREQARPATARHTPGDWVATHPAVRYCSPGKVVKTPPPSAGPAHTP
jgi:hypothetical protein